AAADAPPPPASPSRHLLPGKMPEMGILDGFMKDPQVTEIMVNDVRNVMVEKAGRIVFSGFALTSLEELNRLARAILDVTGRILSPDQPYVDTMLPDGSRVNIIGPPLTVGGPCITIRKFPTRSFTIEDLLSHEMLDRRMAHFLSVCVAARMNIIISGGTGSGKTTLLGGLMAFIPKGERVVTIEDTPELAVAHFNSVRLQTKPQSPTVPAITARELVANALRMRPDRLIIGECRRAESLDMLQAMNTGHEGSMTTIHANTPRDAISRLETLCMTSGVEIPLMAIRKQIQSAVDLIIQVKRFRDGKRRVTAVTEVTAMEGDTVTSQEIFQYDTESGRFKFTGFVPTLVERLREQGVELPKNYFA
ncbi:MAG: CpaF family protein, partial [Oligoflexia bacterium]|nr:CpaF family protein [Oligoflexia bacterium]